MANYASLKANIEAYIKTNYKQEITGAILQGILKSMTNVLGEGYQFGGLVAPTDDPGTTDAKKFFVTGTAGTYTNFGGLVVNAGEIAFLIYDTSWTKKAVSVVTIADVTSAIATALANYYTKTQTDALLADKASVANLNAEINNRQTADTALSAAIALKQDIIDASHKLLAQYVDGLSDVATSGDYEDLDNLPKIGGVTLIGNKSLLDLDIQAKIDATNKLLAAYISGLANVATSGDYNDLSNKPTIPTVPTIDTEIDAQSVNTETAGAKAVYDIVQTKQNVIDAAHKLPAANVDGLANVATSGSYNDLSNKPSIPDAVQVTTIPAASAALNGKVYQYVGVTDSNYTNGYFYKCDGSTWARVNVQPGGTINWGDIAGTLANQTDLKAALDKKANVDGVYETLVSGSAMNLVGRGSVGATFTRRTTGGTTDVGSGTAQIKKVKGKSLVWNQQYSGNVRSEYGITASIANGIITINGTAERTYSPCLTNFQRLLNHKYLTYVHLISNPNNLSFHIGCLNTLGSISFSGGIGEDGEIKNANSSGEENMGISSLIVDTSYDGIQFKFFIVDLTQMFGAGNEPATVDEFKALFPLDYYAYNAGEIISFNGEAIKTDGFNQYNPTTGKVNALAVQYQITGAYTSITQNGETITPDANGLFTPSKGELTIAGGDSTTCVHFVHSGVRNGEYEQHWEQEMELDIANIKSNGVAVFPDGMRSAGTVYDELVIDADGYARKAIKRIGSVDLGSLVWDAYGSPHNHLFRTKIIGKRRSDNLITTNYSVKTAAVLWEDTTTKGISGDLLYLGVGLEEFIAIQDTNYQSASAFASAMSGVMLYYELATPVEYTLDTPIYCNYREDDWGTEELLPTNDDEPTTTPFVGDIQYPLNASDAIRNLPKNYAGIAASGTASTIGNLLEALKTANIIASYTITYDSTNQRYNFSITKYTE